MSVRARGGCHWIRLQVSALGKLTLTGAGEAAAEVPQGTHAGVVAASRAAGAPSDRVAASGPVRSARGIAAQDLAVVRVVHSRVDARFQICKELD